MKKKSLFIPLLALLTGCASLPAYPFGGEYNPKLGYEITKHATDDCINVDGVLNEKEYAFVNHLYLHKQNGAETADLDILTYFGYEGVVLGIDVTENTTIWCNPNRTTYLNSGIEMYMSKADATSYGINTLEIDLVADGRLDIRRNIGGSTYSECQAEDAINPFLETKLKESGNGYTHELFIPYEFFRKMGFCESNEDVTEFCCDFVHIVSRNFEGTNPSVDRSYYCFGKEQLDEGSSWVDPSKTYRFNNKVGFVCYDLYMYTDGNGTIEELYGRNHAVPENSMTLLINPEDGELESIYSLLINDKENVGRVKAYKFGGYYITLNKSEINEDLTIDVIFDC